MGEVRVPADARWGAQTQRAVENFPISGRPVDARVIRALALIKREAAAVNAARRRRSRGRPAGRRRDRRRRRRGRARRARRRVPDRPLPDRFRHVDEHERQRGARRPRVRTARRTRAPQRPGQRVAVVQRRVPVGGPPCRRAGDRRRPRSRRREAGEGVAAQAAGVRPRGEVGPHAPHGRHARHARPGVRRLRIAGRRRDRAPARLTARACACSRSAAPRSAPASTHRRASPPR